MHIHSNDMKLIQLGGCIIYTYIYMHIHVCIYIVVKHVHVKVIIGKKGSEYKRELWKAEVQERNGVWI